MIIGYEAYESNIFNTKDSAYVLSWPVTTSWGNISNKKRIIKYFKEEKNLTIEKVELRVIPLNFKRSKYDNANLLVIYLPNGEILAKRHNNSQWLTIEV